MNKRKLVVIFLVLFLFIYTDLGETGSKGKAMSPAKMERGDAGIKVTLPTVDNEWVVGNFYPGGHKQIIIVLNDTSEHINVRAKRELCTYLGQHFDILNIDYRGYGESSGEFTGGNTEILDIQAALNFLKSKKYEKVGVMGFGFGGYLAIQSAPFLESVDSIVTVNAPYYLYRKDSKEFDQDGVNLMVRLGQAFLKHFIGVRVNEPDSDQSRSLQPYLESMEQPLQVIYVKGMDWVSQEENRQIYEEAKHPKSYFPVDEEQTRFTNRQIVYDRAVEWFKQIFITR